VDRSARKRAAQPEIRVIRISMKLHLTDAVEFAEPEVRRKLVR
jgi:hypothetical protein